MTLHKEQLSELWDEITPKLYGYLLHALRDRALADDILQAAWLKAIEGLPDWNPRGGGFAAWLWTIARNEMRMHWRKQGREVPYDAELHDTVSDDSESENRILAEEIVQQLAAEDRELLRLRFIADLPLGDMAAVLRMHPVTLRVKLHRAIGRARLLYKEHAHE